MAQTKGKSCSNLTRRGGWRTLNDSESDAKRPAPESPGEGLVDLPLRPAPGASRDLEFDPLEGDEGAAAGAAGGRELASEPGRGGRAGGRGPGVASNRRRLAPVLVALLLVAAAVIWLLFPDPPRVAFSVDPVRFETIRVGESSAEAVVALTNLGERKLSIKALTFDGPVEEDYEIVENGCLGSKIPSGEGCEVRIAFSPRAPGDRSSVLMFESNDPAEPGLRLEAAAVAPELGLAPSALSFGVLPLESEPESRTVTLSNIGSATLEFRRIRIEGPAADDFSRSRRCPSSKLEPGDACSFDLRFNPSVSGPRRAELVVDSDALNSPARLALEGVGLWEGPPLDPEAETTSFAEQVVGKRSGSRKVAFSNRTGGPVAVDRTEVSGSSSFAVVADRCAGRVVASGGSCSVDVTFLPVQDGADEAVLTLSAAGATEPVRVALRGRGVTPKIEAATRELDFEQQRLGFESAPRRVRVRNTGSATVTVRSVSISGADGAEFLLGTNECLGKPLAPGKVCAIAVGFNPARGGPRSAALSIDPGFDLKPIRVPLRGSGVASALRADPGRLDFGRIYLGGVESRVLSLANEGSARLELRGLRFEGDDAAAFELGRIGCSLDSGIAAGAACDLEMAFEPGAARSYRAQLVLEYNGPDSPARVELAGEGREPAPAFRISANALDLGSAPVGGRGEIGTVSISNPGAAWLPLTRISLEGARAENFQLVAGSCDGVSALAPSGRCTVGVRLVPLEAGPLAAEILVRHGADTGRATVTLSGRGLPGPE